MDGSAEHRNRLALAFLKAVHEHSLTEVDGESTLVINAAVICDALAIVAAAVMEPAPACATEEGMSVAADAIRDEVLGHMKHMRGLYETMGARVLDSMMADVS